MIPHVPRPPIQIIPLNHPGSTFSAPLAIAGAHVTYFGGPVISNVHIVAVLYGSGAYLPNIAGTATPTLSQFYTDITQSSYFDLLNEYSTVGVKAADGTAGTNQTIGHGFFDGLFTITPSATNDGPSISDAQIQSELLAQVAAGKLPAPVFDTQGNDNTLYMIFFPPGKTITAGGATSCVRGGFCAYHNSTTGTFASHRLFYGVHPDIQPPSGCSQGCGNSPNVFDNVTNVTSHELSEAVTDADVGPATTFARPLAWIDQTNGEIGDICVGQDSFVAANNTTYTVQREFSNLQNDCVAGPIKLQIGTALSLTVGQQFDLPVTIATDNGGPLPTYGGTIHFTSTDPTAVLPADYTFSFADAGSHTFVVSLKTPGPQTITATDTSSPSLTGTASYTVNTLQAANFAVAMPGNAVTGVAIPVFVKAHDQFGNVATGYTGTIHFSSGDSTAALPANAPLTNGTGTFLVTFNTAGTQGLVVQDAGNTTISGSSFSNVAAPPTNPTVTVVTASPNPAVFGQATTFTATVTQAGVPVTTGLVSFTLDGSDISNVSVDVTGHAQTSGNFFGGQYTVFADFNSGSTAIPRSSSSALAAVVNPAPTTISVNSTGSPSTFGDPLAIGAQISTAASSFNGGTVTFTDSGVPIAVISSFSSSVSFAAGALPPGSHSIVASYAGNSNFAPAASAPFVQVVNPAPAVNYTLSADKTSATISAGQAATFLITTKSLSGFDGIVKLSCGPLPAFTTCLFTPSSALVSPFGTTVVSTLKIQTAGPNALLSDPIRKRSLNALWWTASPFAFGFLLLGAGPKRKRWFAVFSAIVLSLILAGFLGCGGGSSTPPPPPPRPVTPAGAASIAVNAVGTSISGANATNPSQQLALTVTVQ